MSSQEADRLAKYSTADFLRSTINMARLTCISFWRRHKIASRIVAFFLLAIILFSIFSEFYERTKVTVSYDLSGTITKLLDEPIPLYGEKLVYNTEKNLYSYNEDYQPGGDVSGDSYAPKIEAKFEGAPNYTTTVSDPINNVFIALKPKFALKDPIKDQNRVVYPINGLGNGASKVYTLKGSGVKEDILLREKPAKDKVTLKYELSLSEGLEARVEADGSVGVYGVDAALLGNVTTGSEQDAELLQKARENGKKTQFLFKIPAPFVVEKTAKNISQSVKASFSLSDKELALNVTGLRSGTYPLSIDPTIYVETAQKLMRGNNETNIDFDVSNELIQKSQTTGARIDAWSSTTDLTSAVYGQGTAVAGGYIYSVGGVGSGTTTTSTFNTAGTSTFNVPASGVSYITIKSWGGGGGAGAGTGGTGAGGSGGGGGYAKAVISVSASETLDITVGAGGAKATANGRGGSGGSASFVKRGGTFLVEAAGGGGGSGRRGNTGGTTGNGGAGGGATGVAGTTGSTGGPGQGGAAGAGGTGGTAGAGGAAGVTGASQGGGNGTPTAACNTAATGTGSTGAGGNGGTFTTTCAPGGGGGGGYYGGGGGGSTSTNARTGGGGGGGSSYINPTGLVAGTDVNTAGSGTTPGNSGDSSRGGLADGGAGATTAASATAGENGIIVISYTTVGSISNKVYWAKFNQSTNAIESPNPGAGACSGWCNNTNYDLPTALTGLSLVAYNGFLYAIGGSNSGGTPQTTVYIAKLGVNGEPQLWHPSGGTPTYWYSDTALGTARSQFAAVAYNNHLYILGGLSASTTVLSSNTVQYADIRPNGTLTTWTSTGMQALSGTGGGNRYGLTAHIYNDTMYVIGGDATFSGTPVTNVDYSKLNSDGTMNTWVTTDPLVTSGRLSLGGSFSTVFGGYIYVNGGCTTVNASGYCTAIATDVQLSSINADGSLAGWNTIAGLTNDRFSHTMIAWQGGLYRLGGCRDQDAITGACTNTVLDVDYGVINPDGEASTVATSVTSGSSPCSGSTPYNCSLPTSSVGNMLNVSAIVNGYLYVMGGCTNNACTTFSSGVTYQAIGSDGSLQRPSSCAGTFGTSGADSYCVSNVSLPIALGAAGVTIFNNRIYVVGGFPSVSNIYYVSVNADGSLGAWQNNDTNTGTTTAADAVSYTYAYARANPSSAGSNPGNMFIIGGCSGSIVDIGCSGYSSDVYKCNITSTGTVTSCATTSQLQIGTVTGNDGNPTGGGLGAFAGAVYANYIYLMGGLSTSIASNGTDLRHVRYAKFDDSNNIVAVSGSDWVEGSNVMVTGRRRGAGFGYNGFLYVLGGYDGADAIADIEFAKINVSDGSWEAFDQSSVTIQKRWALTSVVSNSYAYVIGGCTAGPAPGGCTTRTDTIQTFQIYNNDSGTPVSYSAAAAQFTTDRMGAGTVIYNGKIYVAGGCVSTTSDCSDATDNVQFATVDIYGTISGWANTTDATLPGQRAHGKLLEAGGTLYWVGGQDDAGTASNEVYYGTPAADGNVSAWTLASNILPAARSQFGAAEWNDRLYITGGVNSGTVQSTVYVSPSLSSGGNIGSAWTSLTGFDVARSGHSTIAYANNLYVFGGYDGTNYLSDSQFTQINSDGTVDAWTFTTNLPTPLRQADAFAVNGYIYVVGGRTSDTSCASKTLVTPVSANTTIATGNNPTGVGEWFETNVRYSGRRYGGSVAYANGKYYVSGGVCNGFPSVKDRLTQTFATAATAHAVTMPAAVDSGDLLMVLITNDHTTAGTITTPAGWTSKASDTQNTQVRASVFIKVADGTEDGTTVDFATSAAEEAAAQVYRIPNGEWSGTTAGVEVATFSGAATNTPNPASLNPGAWGTENTLWIAYVGGSSYNSVTTYPSTFTGGVHNQSNTGTGGASASSAWLESAVASVDPGTFTMGNSTDGVAYTIAIRPSGYALTGSNKIVQTAVYSQPQVAKYSRMIDTDTDVFPNSFLLNGLDNSIGARWQVQYRSMHDINPLVIGGSDSVNNNGGTITQSGTAVVGNNTKWTSALVGATLVYADASTATVSLVTDNTHMTVSASKTILTAQNFDLWQLQQNPNEDCGTSSAMAAMTTWGQETNYGSATLGDVAQYMAADGTVEGSLDSGDDIHCARYYYFTVSIDASKTFGYPEDVNRGPTISDLSLFFTSDPSKRLRHGKTFTGGEQQPLDTPCRQSVDAQCPLP